MSLLTRLPYPSSRAAVPQAMSPQYDALYAALPHFRFESCYPFYLPANEQAWTLGLPGFPEISSWAEMGIVWLGDGTVGGDRDDR